jgi:hypothetical protein
MGEHRGHPSALGNGHHIAHCEPTLVLMESIAETIPDAILHVRAEAWKACAAQATAMGLITASQAVGLLTYNPTAPVPPLDWDRAPEGGAW